MWHVTRDTWHVTRDTWHVTCLRGGVNILSKFQLPSSYCLWFMLLCRSGSKGSLTDHMRPRRSVIRVRRTFGCLVSVLGTCDSGCHSSCDSGCDFLQDPVSVLRTYDCGCDPGCDFGCDCCCDCDSGCRFDCDCDFECDLNIPFQKPKKFWIALTDRQTDIADSRLNWPIRPFQKKNDFLIPFQKKIDRNRTIFCDKKILPNTWVQLDFVKAHFSHVFPLHQ